MDVLGLLLILALLGLATWAIVTFIPMPAGFQRLIIIVAVVVAVVYVLNAFGIFKLPNLAVPQLR